MKTLFAAAAAFAAVATAAMAQPDGDPGSNSQSGTAKSNEKGERLICRWVQDSDIGSLVSGRTRRCLTAEQWRALRR
ncbi:hypothetical protein [Sphingosinicella sp.]|uniref:hypothetical protein n=1 Tax=Sphingosinicella sp. TaxID=1917971 RepID=UPI0040380BA2